MVVAGWYSILIAEHVPRYHDEFVGYSVRTALARYALR